MATQADVEGASVDPKTGQTVHTEGRSDSERRSKAYATLTAVVKDLEKLLTKAQEAVEAMDREDEDVVAEGNYGAEARNVKAK